MSEQMRAAPVEGPPLGIAPLGMWRWTLPKFQITSFGILREIEWDLRYKRVIWANSFMTSPNFPVVTTTSRRWRWCMNESCLNGHQCSASVSEVPRSCDMLKVEEEAWLLLHLLCGHWCKQGVGLLVLTLQSQVWNWAWNWPIVTATDD